MGADLPPDGFDELLSMGARYVLELEIEGIPWNLPETLPRRIDSQSRPSWTVGCEGACPALLFDEGAAITIEIDRETGFARGDALEITLAWEALEEYGLTTALFARPTVRSRLTSDLSATALTVEVDSTTGWTAGDLAYIGREVAEIDSVTDADTFVLDSRSDIPYRYRASSPTTFGRFTDKPEVWQGRFVTLHMHLLTPDGRMLDNRWRTGTYHRVLWRGFVDGIPKPGDFGMQLRALPLVRIAGMKLGHELGAEIVVPDPEDHWSFADHPIVVTPEAVVTLEGEFSGAGSGTFRYTIGTAVAPYVSTVQGWCATLAFEINSQLGAEAWYQANSCEVGVSGLIGGIGAIRNLAPGMLVLKIGYASGYSVTLSMIVHDVGIYWLTPGHREAKVGLGPTPRVLHFSEGWPAIALSYPAGAWLPVVQTSGEGYADVEIPSSGVGIVEVDGERELVRWDDTETPAAPRDHIRLMHITERGVGGTPILDLGAGAELKFVSGHDGTPAEILLTLLESSGTGLRGDYDTLGLGLGYGVPSDYINEASFERIELLEDSVAAYSDGRSSLEEMMGGWLALQGLCVVQRRKAPASNGGTWNTAYQLAVVRTDPAIPAGDLGLVVTLEPSDVEMGGVGLPDTIDSPTEVRVARSGVERDRPDVMPQDVPAIQALGLITKEFSAPGMSEAVARDAAISRIASGLGTTPIQLGVVPWLMPLMWPGDLCKIALAHPKTYDWKTGTRGPATIYARVVGKRFWLRSGRFEPTLMMAGMAPEGLYLCPGTTVATVDSTTAFTTSGDDDVALFAPSGATIKAILYNPGEEATELGTVEIDGTGTVEWTLSTGTLPAWVAAGVTHMTFAELGTNDAELDDAHMFFDDARRWGV